MKRLTGRKRSVVIVLLLLGSVALSACGDEFLTRTPQDQISNEVYWTSPNDLRLYVNQFYEGTFLTFSYWHPNMFYMDGNSDNMAPVSDNVGDETRVAGLATINTGNGQWNDWYSQIRDVNFMLVNAKKMGELSEEGKRYVGEARFFRAIFYYKLLQLYGGVPWITEPLTTESEALYAPSTPRNQLVDHILDDLDYAVAHLPPESEAGQHRLNKESALLYKSRVALYEGTWEKYHQGTPFGVEDASIEEYLRAAAEAAKTLIDMGTASIYSTGGIDDYRDLFNQLDLSGNPEVFLWQDYNATIDVANGVQRRMTRHGGGTGLTKSLVDSYLMIDGKSIAVSPLYQGDETLKDVVANRDSRLDQILKVPGDTMWIDPDGTAHLFSKPQYSGGGVVPTTTGYSLEMGRGDRPVAGQGEGETAAVIFRYAEALLNYAEAKAELGEITQHDLDISINKLRDRVGMPHLMLGSITPDPNWDYPELSPIINEIRRERRVELACQGFRFDDIMRWAAAEELLVGETALGANFTPSQFSDLEIGVDIFVNENGYIAPYQKTHPDGYGFDPSRDYLLAIPPEQLTLNENLTQNPGW